MTRNFRQYGLLMVVAIVLAVAGCSGADSDTHSSTSSNSHKTAQASQPAHRRASTPKKQVCSHCGTIVSIDKRHTQGDNTSTGAVIGTVAGAVAGVAIGNQIGHGTGKDIAKAVGGIGGAAAGHKLGKRLDTKTYYAVTVKMESGGNKLVNVADASALSVGQHVSVENGNIGLP